MRSVQSRWSSNAGWSEESLGELSEAQVVLIFGGRSTLGSTQPLRELAERYPKARLIGCSTAGEIQGVQVSDDTIVATAIQFERSRVDVQEVVLADCDGESRLAGRALANRLDKGQLRHVFVLSDGTQLNGSELVQGLTEGLPQGVTLSGGLSGDGAEFETTLVLCDDQAQAGSVAALAFYGESLEIRSASLGGWDPFGPERIITRSEGNVLYELDGRSALGLYKEYLGEHAEGLPATGLLFPLTVREQADQLPVVRTILAVDEENQSLTFAGDVPEGSFARLMHANFDRLVDGAGGAARNSSAIADAGCADLAILISCVGRKMVLGQRIEEELEAVRDVLGEATVLTGFYSYGEISPFTPDAKCELHNQTMTITTISEVA